MSILVQKEDRKICVSILVQKKGSKKTAYYDVGAPFWTRSSVIGSKLRPVIGGYRSYLQD